MEVLIEPKDISCALVLESQVSLRSFLCGSWEPKLSPLEE